MEIGAQALVSEYTILVCGFQFGDLVPSIANFFLAVN